MTRTARLASTTLAAALAFALSACGGAADTDSPSSSPTVQGGPVVARPADGALEDLRGPLATTASKLAVAMADEKGNSVVSPVSLAFAFGLLREGARGSSASQIDTAFGLPGNGTALLHDLADDLQADPGAPSDTTEPALPTVSFASHFMTKEGEQIRPEFTETLASQGARHETFTGAEDGATKINAWAKDATRGLIPEAVSPADLSDATRLTLSNATYFSAGWAMSDRGEMDFTTKAGERVSVPAFGGEGHYATASGANYRAVRLPYGDGQWSMWVLVPTDDTDPATLLAPETFGAVQWTEGKVDVRVPKFDLDNKQDLSTAVQSLGVRDVFSPERADLTGIGGEPGDYVVGKVLQNATISVDEKGTEAAAVTVIMVEAGAAPGYQPPPVPEFRADRAFAYAIVHDATRTPLFAGTVGDPR